MPSPNTPPRPIPPGAQEERGGWHKPTPTPTIASQPQFPGLPPIQQQVPAQQVPAQHAPAQQQQTPTAHK